MYLVDNISDEYDDKYPYYKTVNELILDSDKKNGMLAKLVAKLANKGTSISARKGKQ